MYSHQSRGDSFKFMEILQELKEHRASPSSKVLTPHLSTLYSLEILPSYQRYNEIIQVLDSLILDVESLQYSSHGISLSIIFSILLLDLNIFTPKELVQYEFENENLLSQGRSSEIHDISQSDQNLQEVEAQREVLKGKIKKMDQFVTLFSIFLQEEFGIQYDELEPTREFVCPYAGGVRMSIEENKVLLPGRLNPSLLNRTVSHRHF